MPRVLVEGQGPAAVGLSVGHRPAVTRHRTQLLAQPAYSLLIGIKLDLDLARCTEGDPASLGNSIMLYQHVGREPGKALGKLVSLLTGDLQRGMSFRLILNLLCYSHLA